MNAPQMAGIWLVLLILAAAALVGLFAPGGLRDPRQLRAWLLGIARQQPVEDEETTAEAAEAARYAEEIAVAAHRAAVTAQRRREQWHAAQLDVERAWDAYRSAEAAVTRAGQAAAFAAPATSRTPAQYAEREQFLHRSATSACRRGDLSIEQLSDVLAGRAGWNPRLHPVEQELCLARAAAAHRLAAYRQASAAERAAWHTADVAAAALRALRQEAATAIADPRLLGRPIPAAVPQPVQLSAARPSLATP